MKKKVVKKKKKTSNSWKDLRKKVMKKISSKDKKKIKQEEKSIEKRLVKDFYSDNQANERAKQKAVEVYDEWTQRRKQMFDCIKKFVDSEVPNCVHPKREGFLGQVKLDEMKMLHKTLDVHLEMHSEQAMKDFIELLEKYQATPKSVSGDIDYDWQGMIKMNVEVEI